jgi:hypothetical protein
MEERANTLEQEENVWKTGEETATEISTFAIELQGRHMVTGG